MVLKMQNEFIIHDVRLYMKYTKNDDIMNEWVDDSNIFTVLTIKVILYYQIRIKIFFKNGLNKKLFFTTRVGIWVESPKFTSPVPGCKLEM